MNTRTKEIKELVDGRVAEVKDIIKSLKNGTTVEGKVLSANTCSTQLHHRTKELRILALVADLIKNNPSGEFNLSEEGIKGLNQLTTPQTGNGVSIIVSEGDSILALMEKYSEVKDLQKKMVAACDKQGLMMDYSTGTISKK